MLNYENEEWKPVVDFEWLYEISNYGRVKTLRNLVETNDNKLIHKILRPSISKEGYPKYSLTKKNRVYYFNSHRLVALAFLPNPLNLEVVNHKDGDKFNNHVSNLEWCTHSENLKHAFRLGLKEGNKGEDNHLSVLNSDEVLQINKMINDGIEYKDIASEFNISDVTICDIKRGKTWGWLTGREQKERRKEIGPEIVKQVYKLAKEGKIYQKEIAKKFGISQAHVSEILNGKMWANITNKL